MNDREAELLRQGEGERTGQMTGDDPTRLSEHHGNADIRFASNFSVYVLPPDVVCLYSEDRKFFLHGELYCALASRIGAGEPREAIVRALAREFPADKIDEAFKRLHDRRFVVPASTGDGAATAYWASLGLRPETAAENLGKFGVRIQSMGAAGESEVA